MQQLFLAWARGAEAVSRAYDPVWRGMARMSLGTATLLNQRTQAYLELSSRFGHCRTPQDVLEEQSRFWRTASDQYAGASRELFDAWLQAMGVPRGAAPRQKPGKVKVPVTASEPPPAQAAGKTGKKSRAPVRPLAAGNGAASPKR